MEEIKNQELEFQLKEIDLQIQHIELQIASLSLEKEKLNYNKLMLTFYQDSEIEYKSQVSNPKELDNSFNYVAPELQGATLTYEQPEEIKPRRLKAK